MALWDRDFWLGFRTKLSILKKRFSWPLNQEHAPPLITEAKSQQLLWGPEGEAFWADSGEALWAGDTPSFVDIAKRLIKALPASDRGEASTLLVTELLPEKWATVPTFLVPRELFEKRVKRLANELQQAPENQRLHLLRADLCQSEIADLSFDSNMLAIARYMHEHPEATPKYKLYWLDFEELSKWTTMSIPEIEEKALQLWANIEKWDESAQLNHPDIWEQYKLTPFNAQLDLEAAYSGSFHVAMGDLASFLDAVGASFEEIRLAY